jgi:hypothetical protein
MKRLAIGVLLTITSSIVYCQPSSNHLGDSNKMIMVTKWKLERLLDSHFYDLPTCKTSLQVTDSLTSILKLSLAYSDSLNQIKSTKIQLQATQLTIWEKRHGNTIQANKERINDLKKKKNRLTLIAIGEAVLLVLIIL